MGTILAFLISLPFLVAREGAKFGQFVELFKTNPVVSSNLITSGLYFYLYNELATLTIKKTSATTQSVANTAKRVIVIVGSALAFGESLEAMKMLGCSICIGGVFAYSSSSRGAAPKPCCVAGQKGGPDRCDLWGACSRRGVSAGEPAGKQQSTWSGYLA